MSYLELKGFRDDLFQLGYEKYISTESFRSCNFPLLIDVLYWLLESFGGSKEVEKVWNRSKKSLEELTENERIEVVGTITQLLSLQTGVKLNPVKIYRADGYAVQELVKVTKTLVKALRPFPDRSSGGLSTHGDVSDIRSVVSQITEDGAKFFELLESDVDYQEECAQALRQQLNISTIESFVSNKIQASKDEIATVEEQCSHVAETESSLDAKIERKKSELQRTQQRLQALKKIRPSYMDDLERIQAELRECQEEYVSKFQSLAFFKHQMGEREQTEREVMSERLAAVRRLADRFNEEEYLELADQFEKGGADPSGEGDEENYDLTTRKGGSSSRPRAIGNMTGEGLDDSESLDISDMSGDPDGLSSDETSDLTDRFLYGGLKQKSAIENRSIILPVRNASAWLSDCLKSISIQTAKRLIDIEVSTFDDVSTDDSHQILSEWAVKAKEEGIDVKIRKNQNSVSGGVGYAKNRCVEQSSGEYLCFLDSDDVMGEKRIEEQLEVAIQHHDAIIGCQFTRDPPDSTARYTRWANSVPQDKLDVQVLTSHGPTVIMPTWFCHRSVYERVGGFVEGAKGTPEDLIFFYKHLDVGGRVLRVDQPLLMYRYHPGATTFSISEKTIWDLRVRRLEENFISKWDSFYIWNAGKQGRQLYRSLSESSRKKVKGLCDVDPKKIAQGFYTFEFTKELPRPKIPIVHYTEGKPPFVVCVKLDMTNGDLERNLEAMNLVENESYVIFS